MRVLVCGGRKFKDQDFIWRTLTELDSQLGPFKFVIHGGVAGVDSMAADWAESLPNKEQLPYLAWWTIYGRAAGAIRNKRMLKEGKPEIVIAFPGGKGTANMVSIAKAAGVKVIEIQYKT